ncbi:MAG: hypothetical protein CMH62_03170 [Nanoarchaeota archaeon]|nr:hypothetical protein [Nanoarchaeota archaeon]|tara:strand:+ start:575 stop:1168 length:594 start_codon:yes stop_codon:yes gene_type:complete
MVENNNLKKEKIRFVRQDTNKTKRLKKIWRKPKGLQSKLRLGKKGHARTPSQGYRSPRSVRLKESTKLVHNLNDLENVERIIIASTVGLRKKVDLVKKAKELKIKILNLKDVDKFLKDVEEKLSKKKEVKKTREAKKQKTKDELEKKEAVKEEKSEEEEKKEVSKKLTEGVKQKPVEAVAEKAPTQQIQRATAPKQK